MRRQRAGQRPRKGPVSPREHPPGRSWTRHHAGQPVFSPGNEGKGYAPEHGWCTYDHGYGGVRLIAAHVHGPICSANVFRVAGRTHERPESSRLLAADGIQPRFQHVVVAPRDLHQHQLAVVGHSRGPVKGLASPQPGQLWRRQFLEGFLGWAFHVCLCRRWSLCQATGSKGKTRHLDSLKLWLY